MNCDFSLPFISCHFAALVVSTDCSVLSSVWPALQAVNVWVEAQTLGSLLMHRSLGTKAVLCVKKPVCVCGGGDTDPVFGLLSWRPEATGDL